MDSVRILLLQPLTGLDPSVEVIAGQRDRYVHGWSLEKWIVWLHVKG
jgi:hypothetical protein